MLFVENPYLKEFESKIKKIENNNIILEETAFYARSGGQPGDIGKIILNEKEINIIDTIYDHEKNIAHICEDINGLKIGDKINGKIISKHHTLDHSFVVEDKTKLSEQSYLLESFSFENKRFSSREITTEYLTRIKHLDPLINSFITVCEESALTESKVADEIRANGDAHSLTGVPYANKDLFCTKSIRTTCASRMLQNFVPPYDAEIVTRARKNSLVMLGKTNMDEFAMGSSNETSFFGNVQNPWGKNLVPGGSSGG